MSIKDLQKNFSDSLVVGHTSALNQIPYNTVGDYTAPIGKDHSVQVGHDGYVVNTVELRGTNFSPSATIKQDFSEADGEGDFESLFPELYSKFNKHVEELNKYVGLAESPWDFMDETQRIGLFGKLSYAMRKSSEALAWAFVQEKMAYARRREAEAISALDDFPQYISDQADQGVTVKATDATRESFVKMSKRVIKAHQREAMVSAMVEQLSVLKMEFSEASKTLRSMVYGQKDSNNLSSLNNTGA